MEGIAGPDKTPARIAGMFDAIAPRYDLLNRVLSAGLDKRWRDRAVAALELPPGARVLDLCTGTADLAVATVRRVPGASVVGVDFASAMLRLGLAKIVSLGLGRSIQLVRGDATGIPVGSATCDAATIAFGIRNVAEPERALAEIARVLQTAWPACDPRVRPTCGSQASVRSIPGTFAACCRPSAAWSRSTPAPTRTSRRRSAPSLPPGNSRE